MPTSDFDALDSDVPAQAVKGLNAASKRARESGRPQVLVRDGKLIRLTADGSLVLKHLPPRRKVEVRRKVFKP